LGDPESIRNIYTPGKALDMMSVVNSSLEKVQDMLKLLENFSNSLDRIVEETRQRRCA
jgi:hypothetical protein